MRIKSTTTCNNMNRSHKHNIEEAPDIKRYKVYYFIYIKYKNRQN